VNDLKKAKINREKMKQKIFHFVPMTFEYIKIISGRSPILADVENITCFEKNASDAKI
jgi:hypothetical protein